MSVAVRIHLRPCVFQQVALEGYHLSQQIVGLALPFFPELLNLTGSNRMLFLKNANLIFDHFIMHGVNVSKRDLLMPDLARVTKSPPVRRRRKQMKELAASSS